MKLSPRHDCTLVSEYSKHKVLALISANTQLVDTDFQTTPTDFNGQVNPDGFRISLRIRTPQNSLPLAIASVEDTSGGAIIFIQLRLFPAAKLFLRLSTALAFVIGTIFFLFTKTLAITAVAILLALLNYVILTLNFHRNADKTIIKINESLQ
ncbi:MAG: hypothetical protein JXR10_11600 [Cyclobacteriaceae bacterium]